MFRNEPSIEVLKAIRCQDIQTGLQGYSVGEFDVLLRIGMAARLAIHIRGGGVIQYEHLKQVSHYLFDIPTIAFDSILDLLAEVGFVRLVTAGKTIKSVLPTVPYFDDMYQQLGEKAELDGLNGLEEASIAILNRLSMSPVDSTTLKGDANLNDLEFQRIIRIGTEGSYIQEFHSPSYEMMLVSPLYFSENAELFADAVRNHGEETVKEVMRLLRRYPGIPYEKVIRSKRLGGETIVPDAIQVLRVLAENAVTQPPTIETSYSGKNHFLFTPPVGTSRISVVEKEIYEKAMAIVACLRQGQHFGRWRVKWPVAIIDAWLDPMRGKLTATTFAREQYAELAIRKICKLVHVKGDYYSPEIIDLPENRRALELAREMLTTSDVISDRGFDESAHRVIFSPAEYRESLIGYRDIGKRRIVERTPLEQQRHLEKLIELAQMGA